MITKYLLGLPIFFPDMFFDQSDWLNGLVKSVGSDGADHYVIVIDAGSTGTRVHAYMFEVSYSEYAGLNLIQEYFNSTTPGLSSYADDPEKGAEMIVNLTRKAEMMIPEDKRNKTHILVRATAGLRLLPEVKAHQLIDYVSMAISKLEYATLDGHEPVSIMNGSDEGIFVWYTVNLLTEFIEKNETMVAMDLGGGSTQITYQIAEDDYSVPERDRYVVETGKNFTLFTHSYLNMGLNAARYGILRMEADSQTTHFTSVCLAPIVHRKSWTYNNQRYFISGVKRNESLSEQEVFSRCYDLVKKYVMITIDWEPEHVPPGDHIAATSSFFYVARTLGMIDELKSNRIPVGNFRDKAVLACSADAGTEEPWFCIDLIYIYSLLHDVYKMSDEKKISVMSEYEGYQVSWALGLAYATVVKKVIDSTLSALEAEYGPQNGGHGQEGGGQGQQNGGHGQQGGGPGQQNEGYGQIGGAQGQQDGDPLLQMLQDDNDDDDDDGGQDQRFIWQVPGSPFYIEAINK